jgi:hypothetical protein
VSDFDVVRVVLDKTLHLQDLAEQRWETGEPTNDELKAAADDLQATINMLDEDELLRLRQIAHTITQVTR